METALAELDRIASETNDIGTLRRLIFELQRIATLAILNLCTQRLTGIPETR